MRVVSRCILGIRTSGAGTGVTAGAEQAPMDLPRGVYERTHSSIRRA